MYCLSWDPIWCFWHALSFFESQFSLCIFRDLMILISSCQERIARQVTRTAIGQKGGSSEEPLAQLRLKLQDLQNFSADAWLGEMRIHLQISNSFKWPVFVTWWLFLRCFSWFCAVSKKCRVPWPWSVCMLMCDQSAWSEQLDAAQIRKVMEGHEMYWSKLSSAFKHKILEKAKSSWLSYRHTQLFRRTWPQSDCFFILWITHWDSTQEQSLLVLHIPCPWLLAMLLAPPPKIGGLCWCAARFFATLFLHRAFDSYEGSR